MLHQISPLLAHEDDRPLHLTLLDGEKLGSRESNLLHGLQIGCDPEFGDIPTNPVPPSLRTGLGRGIGEIGFEGLFGRERRKRCQRHQKKKA